MIANLRGKIILPQIILYIGVGGLSLRHEMMVAHLLNSDGISLGFLLKVGGDNTEQRILVKNLNRNISGARCRKKTKINDSILDPVTDIIVGPLKDLNPDSRILRLKRMDDIRDPVGAGT